MHCVERTNPKGQPFRGVCIRCGREDMTTREAIRNTCPNFGGLTDEEALLVVLQPDAEAKR